MESFFLAETTKYLYLLFDPDNFIHNPGVHGSVINTPNGECVVDVGGYIFNTEAHPIDPSMLYCCHEARDGYDILRNTLFHKVNNQFPVIAHNLKIINHSIRKRVVAINISQTENINKT